VAHLATLFTVGLPAQTINKRNASANASRCRNGAQSESSKIVAHRLIISIGNPTLFAEFPDVSHGTPTAYDRPDIHESLRCEVPQKAVTASGNVLGFYGFPDGHVIIDPRIDDRGRHTTPCCPARRVPASKARDKLRPSRGQHAMVRELGRRYPQRTFWLYPRRLGCCHFRMRQFEDAVAALVPTGTVFRLRLGQ
jgi:hypothetical protein